MKTMKKLRKMVSVILCVIISCMCIATPACAAGKSEASVMGTNTPNIGLQQIILYPGVYDYDTGNVDYYYPAFSPIYPSGTDFLNLQVDAQTQEIFKYNNCNCWVFKFLYCSDTNVTSIDLRFNGKVANTFHSTTSGAYVVVIPNTPYFTYDIVYHLKSGATPTCGGHVNIWQ